MVAVNISKNINDSNTYTNLEIGNKSDINKNLVLKEKVNIIT